MNPTVAKSLESNLRIMLADKKRQGLRIYKAEEGDKKNIFGRPATFRSGKWKVDEPGAGDGGEEARKPTPREEIDAGEAAQRRADATRGEEQEGQSQEEQSRIGDEISKLSPEDQEFAQENFDSEDLDGLNADEIAEAIDELKGETFGDGGEEQIAPPSSGSPEGEDDPSLRSKSPSGIPAIDDRIAALSPEEQQLVLSDLFTDEAGESELEPGETLESVIDELVENIREEDLIEILDNAKMK